MSNVNVVVIAGNLTREPELRQTSGGTSVLQFGIAVNENRHNRQTDQWEDVPSFFDCAMFGRRTEALSRFLHKGLKVTVKGKLRQSSWEKDGQKHSKVDIIAEEVELPPRQKQEETYNPPSMPVQQGYANLGAVPEEVGSVYASDIPF